MSSGLRRHQQQLLQAIGKWQFATLPVPVAEAYLRADTTRQRKRE
jgi:hypothetical protein